MIILFRYIGRLGNQLFEYLAIYNLARKKNVKYKMPQIFVDNKVLPIDYGEKEIDTNLKLKKCCHLLPNLNNVLIEGFFQKYKYLNNSNKKYLFDAFNKLQQIINKNEIVIHIRSEDLFLYNFKKLGKKNMKVNNGHPVIPINFYKKILKNETLPVRFVTKSLNDKFITKLQQTFPNAIFQSTTMINDFNTIIGAKKIVMSISTFSWFASWLSNANEIIFPLYGLFHPSEKKEKEYGEYIIPDERYKYYDFEWSRRKNPWSGTEEDYNKIINANYNLKNVKKYSYSEIIKKYKL